MGVLQIDRAPLSDVFSSFSTGETTILFDYPKAKDITVAQRGYILSYMQGFEAALRADDGTYTDWIDVGSFVDFFLITELTKNVDGYRLSTYVHKKRGGKLVMGPYWDNNFGFGNALWCDGWLTSGWAWRFNHVCPDHPEKVPFWWAALAADAAFVSNVRTRWSELRNGAWHTSQIDALIDGYVASLGEGTIAAEFARWPIFLRTQGMDRMGHSVSSSHALEVIRLKAWIRARAVWLDGAISELC